MAMGVHNTSQSLRAFLPAARWVACCFSITASAGVFAFCSALMLLWLALAGGCAGTAAGKKYHLWPCLPLGTGREDDLQFALIALSGVEAVKLSADKQTVYIKAMQKGFDEAAAKKIISGA